MTLQTSYARLLQNEGLGDAVYYPTPEMKIGDVAYFTGVTYHRCFNVFELSQEVTKTKLFNLIMLERGRMEHSPLWLLQWGWKPTPIPRENL
jgi:hypothetical protein